MIKVTDYKKPIFCIEIYNTPYQFIPMDLFTSKNFLPIAKKVKGSTLGWYVNRRWVSYNQLRNAIRSFKRNND